MRVVFSTGSLYPFGLERVYSWAAEAGFDGVEVMINDRWDTHQDAFLRSLIERHGIPIIALHPPLRRGAWNLGPEETLIRSARLAHRIGAEVVVAHPPFPGRPLEKWRVGTLERAREYGVTVAVENMPRNERRGILGIGRSRNCYLPEDLLVLGEVTLDTSHVGASKVDLMHAYCLLSGQLRHVHLSDSDLTGGDQHRLPGRGRLPLKPLLAALARDGYSGAVSLELKPWPLGTPDPATILERMREALEYTRRGLVITRE
jgi:sugar phosphate isomerase/epimerase